jgi:amino acid adenylation domain-containing protein
MPEGLMVCFDAVDSMFPKGLVGTMFSAYTDLLAEIGSADDGFGRVYLNDIPKGQLDVRKRINSTGAPVSDTLLAERIFTNAETRPDSPALFYGDSTVTYGQMHASVMRVASLLIQHRVKPLDRIAVSVPRGPLQIISVLAVLAAGAVYVPVSVTQPVSRKTKILARAGIKTVLTTMPFDSGDVAVSFVNPMDASACEPLASPVRVHPDSPAYIIFTSGSTGEPKGVEISHRGAMNTILDITRRAGISSSDCAMAISAMDFDLSVFDVFGILGAGGSLVVIDEDERRDASLWLHLVHQHRVTVWNSVPVLLDMLLVAAENDSRPLPIRAVMLSGDWIGLDLPQRLADCCSGSLPAFLAMGGATEGSIWSNLFTVTLPLDPELKSIPYGFPLANQRYRVVDSLGRDCPDFVPGELLIGGTGVALGYVNLPEVTAERFFTENGERWYRTGDQGRYLTDGCLEFLGRKDHQVKVRGHRIELGEIESALRSLPEIVRAVAVTVGNPPQLAVAAETEKQSSVTADEIREKLSSIVPEYMVPNHIEFYESLPVSANGKIDRKAIIGSFSNVNTSMKEEDRPRGELENRVANIWQRILKLENISRNDDFFMSGGDSLTATRFVQTLQQENITSAPLPLRTLFSTPTIASICSYIEQNSLRDHGDAADNSYEEGTL